MLKVVENHLILKLKCWTALTATACTFAGCASNDRVETIDTTQPVKVHEDDAVRWENMADLVTPVASVRVVDCLEQPVKLGDNEVFKLTVANQSIMGIVERDKSLLCIEGHKFIVRMPHRKKVETGNGVAELFDHAVIIQQAIATVAMLPILLSEAAEQQQSRTVAELARLLNQKPSHLITIETCNDHRLTGVVTFTDVGRQHFQRMESMKWWDRVPESK